MIKKFEPTPDNGFEKCELKINELINAVNTIAIFVKSAQTKEHVTQEELDEINKFAGINDD